MVLLLLLLLLAVVVEPAVLLLLFDIGGVVVGVGAVGVIFLSLVLLFFL